MHSIKEKTARNLYQIILIMGIAVTAFSLLSLAAMIDFFPKAHSGLSLEANQHPPKKVADNKCTQCGRIILLQSIETPENPTDLGAIAGGVTGGAVVGNQIGNGRGRTVMTVAGAAGGAYVGNEIEKHARTRLIYEVTVRMDDGFNRKMHLAHRPETDVGERVKIVNDRIIAIE